MQHGHSPSSLLIVFLSGLFLIAVAEPASAVAPATMRVDVVHSGDAKSDHYALDRVLLEPLPWPGNPARPLDDSNRGLNKFEVTDAATGALLYSRGYSTIFGEWQTTAEAQSLARGFGESLRFPAPGKPFKLQLFKRDTGNAFVPAWSVDIDPAAIDVQRKSLPAPATPLAIRSSGASADKVDLLILGDGYTQAEAEKFAADARRLSEHLFSVSPFKERAEDFNVWAMMLPTPESGVSRPSTGQYRVSALGTRYDIFGSERYVLALDNRAFRDLAQYAPYEFVEILVNNETYGGGGIFGQFSTVAAGNAWADYLFVHEFGHHFAGLADEYYTSPVAYQSAPARPEPWEPNVTAMHVPAQLKWRALVQADTALPTSWPKADYESHARDHQKQRAALRAAQRPEAEMNALFRADLEFTAKLFSPDPNFRRIGAFEGANYEARGYYRSQMQCLMFDRSDAYCEVCRNAISTIIDLYSRAPD